MPKRDRTKKPTPTQLAAKSDCVEGLKSLERKAHLIIADPPYNFGQAYDACDDRWTYDGYVEWTAAWLAAAVGALDRCGSMWIFAPDEWVSEIDLMLRTKHKMNKRRHVVWAFTFGQAGRRNFTRSHVHLLYMTKMKSASKITFNDKLVRIPSARQLVYNDDRASPGGKLPDATWMLLKEQMEKYMTPDTDTWLESRVCGTFGERKKHSPNQIPVPIMERIVLACTNQGDLVVDPFCGTGSSGIACALHGRFWTGFDLSQKCVKESNKRIEQERGPA